MLDVLVSNVGVALNRDLAVIDLSLAVVKTP